MTRQLPPIIRARTPGTWAHDTVRRRLEQIGRRVLAENGLDPETQQRVGRWLETIPFGVIEPLPDGTIPPGDPWPGWIAPWTGQGWLDVPWLFAETYFYRRLLSLLGFFGEGPGAGRDPFAAEKARGMVAAMPALRRLAPELRGAGMGAAFHRRLLQSLGGNRADLSLWPAGSDDPAAEATPVAGRLLASDAGALWHHLGGTAGRAHLVVDNGGLEVGADLLMVDFLLKYEIVTEIVVEVKNFPTFVSDVTAADLFQMVGVLAQDDEPGLSEAGRRLDRAVDEGRLTVVGDPFWTSPLGVRSMPAATTARLIGAHLVIVKGDANYRRLLDDRQWPFVTPFAAAVGPFPAPLAALRMLKAEVAAGLTIEAIERAAAQSPDWLTSGRFGVIHFHPGDRAPR